MTFKSTRFGLGYGMITVIATISLHPGFRNDFIAAFNANVPAVLAEDGCVQYEPVVDTAHKLDRPQTLRENVVTVVEKWASLEALHAHLGAPHMATYREQVKDMVDHVDLQVMEPAK